MALLYSWKNSESTMSKFVLTALVGTLFGILMLIVVSEGQYDTAINPVDDAEQGIDLGAKETIDSNDEGFVDDLRQSRKHPDSADADLDKRDDDKGVYAPPQGDDIVR